MALSFLSFTGQSGCYATLPLSLLPGATTFTIEATISTSSTKNNGSNYTWGTIAGREIGGNWQNDFGLCVNNGRLCFWAEPKSGGSSSTRNTTTDAVVNDGDIHKVAVVSANGAIDLYCDGINVAHTDNVNAKITDAYQIYLAYNGDGNSYLQMDLYEIRFWSVARAAEDIGADIDGTEAGLEGWYLPNPNALNDYSGNQRHATLYGSPAFHFSFSADVARHVANRVELSLDVARVVNKPGFFVVNQSLDVARYIVKSLSFSLDVVRIVQNNWRYVNPGTADTLIISGTTLTNLPATQSKTGTAFYQTTRAKCFDLPATSEVWMKFDVYFNGSQRWRAYNGGNNGFTGLTVQTSGDFDYWCNDNNVYSVAGVAARLRVQTILLHMVSGSSDGIIEAWVDGDFIYKYTGDVNHGQDFADIYLQSDGSGTFFSNVIISNAEIGLDESLTFVEFSLDVARRISNRVEFSLDVARYLTAPIHVPLIGNHFNHFVTNLNVFRGGATKIFLPKNGRVYLCGLTQGFVRFYSDTDPQGISAGNSFFTGGDLYDNLYASVDAREKIFVEVTNGDSPVQVIHAFVHFLKVDGYGTHLDEAINYASKGKFASADDLINQFLADVDSYSDYNDFLSEKCDINLWNDDTGAITGSDAGGLIEKTAESIVPEPLPIEKWTVPVPTSLDNWLADDNATMFEFVDIRGITFYFPTNGAYGKLVNTEKFIIAGLINVWLEQALILVEKSLGTGCGGKTQQELYDGAEAEYVKIVYVQFENEVGNLASISTSYQGGGVDSFILRINMRYFYDIDMTSEDGKSTFGYSRLDRVLAHELTHLFLRSNMHSDYYAGYDALPTYIKEGIAELVHGIDDERGSRIIDLLTTRRSDLDAAFSDNRVEENDPYAAGYMLLRYLAKQGQNPVNDFSKSPVTISNLLISDGDIDYDYNALTDNTRQILPLDVARTLCKSLSFVFDVVILHVLRVNFSFDVARKLLARLILFPLDSPFLLRKTALRANPPAAQNTNGLQSMEIAISEQQITDQLKFAGVISFDIMQQVKGQYLDYHFDMRVERVQLEGIVYRCECCSDIDQLLFTQLAYTIPPTTWHKQGETDDTTQDVETVYPPASEHVQKIANALGLQPVMQFDDFLSTVIMDDLGGVTYNDLIRDVFGWSSRVPTQLINCFIRDGKLFVIQRGHESHRVDISDAKHSLPIITRELVRTTWGSTPWSKTETVEQEVSYWQDDDSSDNTVREVLTEFTGSDSQGHTIYTYNSDGLLVQSYTYVYRFSTRQSSYTTVTHQYDADGTLIHTTSLTQSFGSEGESSSRTVERKHYKILPNGEKFLSIETTDKYEGDPNSIGGALTPSKLVDSVTTTHTPSRVGQSHSIAVDADGDVVGSSVGQNTGDDRVTPFSRFKARSLAKSKRKEVTTTENWELTTSGLSLYDSSFPIHNEDRLTQVTDALRWLNRRTKETVILSLYEFPHFIYFNDRVVLNGFEYFLISNSASTTPRIFNEQNLTLTRWF